MAVSVNGLTKKTDTEVTASDITTSDVALISDKVDKLVDQIQKALKFNNNSEKDKKELNATLKDILKQQEQIQDYQETREKLLKRSKNLTKEQREAILADLDEEVLKIFKNFSSLDEELKDTSLIMASKLGVGKNFNKTFTEILETTKRIEKTAKVNQNIRSRNESIDSARKKIGETVGEGVSNSLGTMLYNSLGPLRIFTDPIFRGKNGFFSATSTLFTALGKKVNSSTKTELESKGGTIGKSAVYIGEKIEELSEKSNERDETSVLDTISEGFIKGLGASTLGSTLTSISTVLGGLSFPALLTGGALAVGLTYFLGKTTYEAFTKGFEDDKEDANARAEEIVDAIKESGQEITPADATSLGYSVAVQEYSRWNGFTEALSDLFRSLPGGEEGSFLEGLVGILSLGGSYQRQVVADTQSTLLEASSSEGRQNYAEVSYLYNYLKQQGRATEANKLAEYIKDPDIQSALFGGRINTYNQPFTKNSAIGTPDPRAFVGGVEDPLYQLLMNPYEEEGTGFLGLVKSLKPEYSSTGRELAEKYAQYLDDAIIYKDNSVYVPHPDDNIVLTKDEVSTPVLSGNFEGTLLDILRTIATNTKGSGNVYAINSTPEFDFSMLRV